MGTRQRTGACYRRQIANMKLLQILLLLVYFISAASGTSLASTEDLRIAQIHVLHAKNTDELRGEIVALKRAGFNAIAIRVWQNFDDRFHPFVENKPDNPFTGVYFQTARAPVVVDLLTPLSRICKEENIQLFAWMTVRTMDWLDMKQAKDWVYDDLAPFYAREASHFDLFNQEFQAYLLSLYADLIQTEIQGIILQDDLVIKTREGQSHIALTGFALEQEITVAWPALRKMIMEHRKLFHEWSVYRSNQVASVLTMIRNLAKERGSLKIGMNIYPDSVLNYDNGLHWLAQDIAQLENDPPDFVMFMAYFRQLAQELQCDDRAAIQLIQQMIIELEQRFGDTLVVKYQTWDWLNATEIATNTYKQISKRNGNIALTPVETNSQGLARAKEILNIVVKTPGQYEKEQ